MNLRCHCERSGPLPTLHRGGPYHAVTQAWYEATPWVLGVCFVAALLAMTSRAFADDLAESQVRFGEIKGSVQILAQGSADWVDAQTGLPLEVGDQIRVDEAEISLAQNVLAILDNNSQAVIQHTTTRNGRMTLRDGILTVKVGPGPDGREGVWEFETPVGVCAVRGTEFILVHSIHDGTRLGVFEGAVEMRPAETAEGVQPAVIINTLQEGHLHEREVRKLDAFSPSMGAIRARRLAHLRKRFRYSTGVWTPLTRDYRMELRRKFIAPVAPRKTREKRVVPGKRKPVRR
jgi:hypothetical protein